MNVKKNLLVCAKVYISGKMNRGKNEQTVITVNSTKITSSTFII